MFGGKSKERGSLRERRGLGAGFELPAHEAISFGCASCESRPRHRDRACLSSCQLERNALNCF